MVRTVEMRIARALDQALDGWVNGWKLSGAEAYDIRS